MLLCAVSPFSHFLELFLLAKPVSRGKIVFKPLVLFLIPMKRQVYFHV